MKRIFDNIFFTSFDLKFIRKKSYMDYVNNPRYQLIQIKSLQDWKKYGVKDATLILNDEFEEKYTSVLDKSKKIILVGNLRRNAAYFHFLSSRGYKVYLVKPRKKKSK